MAKGLEDTLIELLGDPAAAAGQADIAQAAALTRQEISFRQRAGAAAAQLRRARVDGADPAEIATLEAVLERRAARLDSASLQAQAADVKRPIPDDTLAQIFGRARGDIEKPPLTAAALSPEGAVLAQAVAGANGTFHMTFVGDLNDVITQISDGAGRVLYRAKDPVSVPAGTVLYLDVSLDPPKPEPGPVPANPKMPELIGQNEGAAVALLCRIGTTNIEIVDEIAEGQPGIVTAQLPKAGTELGSETEVTLTVRRSSDGGQGETFLPGFVGSAASEAEATLKDLALSQKITLRADEGEPGIVLAQTPKEGTPLKDVSIVELIVSRKPEQQSETVTVPSLIGRSGRLAADLLKAAGLEADITETKDSESTLGVTKQDPVAGTTVKRGTTVAITVNTPPQALPGRVAVPSLRSLDQREASRLLTVLKLEPKIDAVANTAPEGRVIGQDPKANTRVEAGSQVLLTVSKGPGVRPGRSPAVTPVRRVTTPLARLAGEMARDPRSDAAGLDADGIAALLRKADIAKLEDAQEIAKLAPKVLNEQLGLPNQQAATRFRAILRKALKALR